MLSEMGITGGRAARYVLLPEVFPRLKTLFASGFLSLPYFIVAVFNALRIIPNNHPYLRAESRGGYSTFQAIAVAANNITFSWKNADKVTVFFVVLAGLAMILLQFILLVMALFAMPAFAYSGPGLGPTSYAEFFDNPNPNEDLAFRLLDMVFGIPGIFMSKSLTVTPFHEGFHALLQFYSFGMLIVGTIIIVYLTIAIVMETAESGVPFGQRFNKAWAPIRVVLFFGLLLPVPPHGINLGQYILLNAARLGSNVATNAWITFDSAASGAYFRTAELVAKPQSPDLRTFVNFLAIARTCSWAEGQNNRRNVQPYFVYGPGTGNAISLQSSTPAFSTMVGHAAGGTMTFRFGVQDSALYPDEPGAVYPYCGELEIPITDQAQPGAAYIQQAYVEAIGCLWAGRSGSALTCTHDGFNDYGEDLTNLFGRVPPYDDFPDIDYITDDAQQIDNYVKMNSMFLEVIDNAVTAQIDSGDWTTSAAPGGSILEYGWAGAGIWFNKIAEQNGALTTAVFASPIVKSIPFVMEYVKKQKLSQDINVPSDKVYEPILSSGKRVTFDLPGSEPVAIILNKTFLLLNSLHAPSYFSNTPESENTDTTGNIAIDTINAIMGTQGLFDMCRNATVNPLAQMSSIGKGLIEHSIRAFGAAAGLGIGSGLMTLLKKQEFAQALHSATSFFLTIASLGLILGFILFYVIPFLPFIFFFFAIMTWVKSIFEAMVGIPLWALAHLRIDGEGMPGDAAESGYFYILEIFLRPVVIIIAFLGSIVIFTAMVKVLNQIFYLVLSNLSGHAVNTFSPTGCFNAPGTTSNADGATQEIYKRGTVDEFFYTVIYTIIVYMIGNACFKLVDLIPDRITRWLGVGISSFGSTDDNPGQGMVKYVAGGAGLVGNQLKNGVRGFGFFN